MRNDTAVGLVVALLLATACSDDQTSSDDSTGAVGGAWGAGGTGGAVISSGGSSVGGQVSAGGQPGSGGNTATGGFTAAGGQSASGGQVATGGTLATGGEPAFGGTGSGMATGGTPATGGTVQTGGEQNMGGAVETSGGGGNSGGWPGDTGGVESTGGTTGNVGGAETTGGSGGDTGGSAGEGTGGGGATITCPASVLASGDTDVTVQVDGQSRSYVLHVPAAYDGTAPVPLVIDFHGITGSGPGERSSSPYPAQTDPDGVIMAFPTGASGPMGAAWNVGPCCVAGVDDVALARAMVEQIQQTACIDPKRIYAVGFSMGGGMSHYLGCHAADLFAAVAPAAFDLLEENVGACEPARPITVVSFRGTSDSIVSYNGGYSSVVSGMPITFLGAQATFETWAEFNQCTGSASPEDGQGCSAYSDCQDGVEVVLCTKQGGGHEAGNASIAWPILKRHTLP